MEEDREQEFLEFLNRYQSAIRRVCRMYADRPEDREELFQEMVFQLWRSYPTFRGESSLGTWMYRVALNTAISAFRRNVRASVPAVPETSVKQLPSPDPRSGESWQIQELYTLIRQLSYIERAVVSLYLEGLSYHEIGHTLGLSESNVGVRLNRIKTKLQSLAKEKE